MSALSPVERESLRAFVDALLPSLPPEAGVVQAMDELVATTMRPGDAARLRGLLRLLARPAGVLALGGAPRSLARLDAPDRERFLRQLATSRVAAKRQAFQAVKKVAMFLAFAASDARWAEVGYSPPDPARRAAQIPPPPPHLPRAGSASLRGARFDVVVVGSGAGGAVVAARLARAGRSVLVVEAGEERGADGYPALEAEGQRDLYEGAGLFASRDASLVLLAGKGAGGGTVVNWMTSLPPPEPLRREWSQRGLDTGPAFLAHVDAVLARLRVGTSESLRNGPNDVLERGARALGWRENEDWITLPRNARGCEARCDTCVFGCPFEAKQDARVTWLADAAAAGARFLFRARVERVLVERGRAVGVRVRVGAEEVDVAAKNVVAAAGSVQTAALLLRSGLRHRALGRLFVHPTSAAIGVHPRPVPMWKGPMQTVAVTRFRDLDGAGHGVLLEAAPAHPGLAASTLPWTSSAQYERDIARLARSAGLIAIARDAHPGRVRLARDGAPSVEHRLARADAQRLSRGLQELARVHRAAGAETIATLHAEGVRWEAGDDFDAFLASVASARAGPHELGLFSAHQMGTAGMGRDGEAVTRPTGETWDVEGLWIADASAFPSPSGVNPMVTIMALAMGTAEKIAAR